MQRESLSEHSFVKTVKIYQSILGDEHCEKILKSYKDIQKIDNTGKFRDNLLNTSRTHGAAHQHTDVAEVWSDICEAMSGIWSSDNDPCFQQASLSLNASWIAVSEEGALVEPHIHASNPGVWSFVFYADIPNGESSLLFSDVDTENIKIRVRKGDVLFFPADLVHFSFDTVPGRTIFSGNFSIHCSYGQVG